MELKKDSKPLSDLAAFFSAPKLKRENERLQKAMDNLGATEYYEVAQKTEGLRLQLSALQQELSELEIKCSDYQQENKRLLDAIGIEQENLHILEGIEAAQAELEKKQRELVVADEDLLMESFALYKPKYAFCNSDQYKAKLEEIRDSQKEMIKAKTAVSFFDNWTVDGSLAKGRKMTSDNVKQILRCFNCECENAIEKVKFNNFDRMEERIRKTYSILNQLNETNKISIRSPFLELKLQELALAHEYQLKLQQEKEDRRLIREQQREEAALLKEIEETRKTIDKEMRHYEQALENAKTQLESCLESDKEAIIIKITEFEGKKAELLKKQADIDYRLENQKAGYVYIISNIGSFGEGVYKIGMTRRLDPQERIDELGDASVPFFFDVHAMIFSADAPALEAALHRAFQKNKMNLINQRREFFRVPLNEIKAVIKENHDKSIEFVDIPSAEQYRETVLMRGRQDTSA